MPLRCTRIPESRSKVAPISSNRADSATNGATLAPVYANVPPLAALTVFANLTPSTVADGDVVSTTGAVLVLPAVLVPVAVLLSLTPSTDGEPLAVAVDEPDVAVVVPDTVAEDVLEEVPEEVLDTPLAGTQIGVTNVCEKEVATPAASVKSGMACAVTVIVTGVADSATGCSPADCTTDPTM